MVPGGLLRRDACGGRCRSTSAPWSPDRYHCSTRSSASGCATGPGSSGRPERSPATTSATRRLTFVCCSLPFCSRSRPPRRCPQEPRTSWPRSKRRPEFPFRCYVVIHPPPWAARTNGSSMSARHRIGLTFVGGRRPPTDRPSASPPHPRQATAGCTGFAPRRGRGAAPARRRQDRSSRPAQKGVASTWSSSTWPQVECPGQWFVTVMYEAPVRFPENRGTGPVPATAAWLMVAVPSTAAGLALS